MKKRKRIMIPVNQDSRPTDQPKEIAHTMLRKKGTRPYVPQFVSSQNSKKQ